MQRKEVNNVFSLLDRKKHVKIFLSALIQIFNYVVRKPFLHYFKLYDQQPVLQCQTAHDQSLWSISHLYADDPGTALVTYEDFDEQPLKATHHQNKNMFICLEYYNISLEQF